MIFNLKSFNDLGKYCTGSGIEIWDTEKDKIFLDKKEVKIEKVEDLFPFLWSVAGVITGCDSTNGSSTQYYFTGLPTPWFEYSFENSCELLSKYSKLKHKTWKNEEKRVNKLEWYRKYGVNSFYNYFRLYDEMIDIQRKISRDNRDISEK